MLRTNLAISVLVVLTGACASSATVQNPTPAPTPKPATAIVAAPTPSPEPTPVAHRKLERGQCEESFDCVDTVGFPPAGQRWTCDEGKCGHAKLPDLADATPAAADASDENTKANPTAKKARKRHN